MVGDVRTPSAINAAMCLSVVRTCGSGATGLGAPHMCADSTMIRATASMSAWMLSTVRLRELTIPRTHDAAPTATQRIRNLGSGRRRPAIVDPRRRNDIAIIIAATRTSATIDAERLPDTDVKPSGGLRIRRRSRWAASEPESIRAPEARGRRGELRGGRSSEKETLRGSAHFAVRTPRRPRSHSTVDRHAHNARCRRSGSAR